MKFKLWEQPDNENSGKNEKKVTHLEMNAKPHGFHGDHLKKKSNVSTGTTFKEE